LTHDYIYSPYRIDYRRSSAWMVSICTPYQVTEMDKTQAIMLGWFDGIQKNEETLQDDIKKIFYEFKPSAKKSAKSPESLSQSVRVCSIISKQFGR